MLNIPRGYVHCYFTSAIIGVREESKHCWVHKMLDNPSQYPSIKKRHRKFLHDLKTCLGLMEICPTAGLVAALHIDLDSNLDLKWEVKQEIVKIADKIRYGDERVVRQFVECPNKPFRKIIENGLKTTFVDDANTWLLYPETPLKTTLELIGRKLMLESKEASINPMNPNIKLRIDRPLSVALPDDWKKPIFEVFPRLKELH